MKRTDVLNYLIKEKGYTSYLEIGTQVKGNNFDKIKAKDKTCVDPNCDADFIMTSDEFFEQNKNKYDIIFIDGLHTRSQSKKDFDNALGCLNVDGAIVIHDALPHNKEYTKPEWCGDVYKTCLELSQYYELRTYSKDHGVCVIFPSNLKELDECSLMYDYEYLKERLNATDNFDDLIPKNTSIDSSLSHDDYSVEANPKLLQDMSYDEVKALYKEKTGKQRVASTVTIEEMLSVLNE